MRPTTTSATPGTSAWRGGRCAPPAPTRGTPSTERPSARSPAGSGSTGTSPTPPPGDESLRPRGWAGMHWSPAIGAEHRATRERAGLFDESSFAKLEISGPGAADVPRRALRQPRRAGRRSDHLHADAQPPRRDRVRLHRHASRGGALLDRHRDRLRQPRPELDPPPRPGRRQRPLHRRDGPLGLLRAVGARGRAEILGPLTPDPLDFALHADARTGRRRRAGAGAARDLRRASSAGRSTARPSTGRGCGARCGRPAASTGCGPAATARSTRCAWRRATGCGRRTSRPTRRPTRRGSASASRRRATSSAREALEAARRASASGACDASSSRTPARWRSATSRCASTARSSDGSPAAATATRSSARSPTPICPPTSPSGTAVEVDIFGQWVRGEVAKEPLFDPKGERVRGSTAA